MPAPPRGVVPGHGEGPAPPLGGRCWALPAGEAAPTSMGVRGSRERTDLLLPGPRLTGADPWRLVVDWCCTQRPKISTARKRPSAQTQPTGLWAGIARGAGARFWPWCRLRRSSALRGTRCQGSAQPIAQRREAPWTVGVRVLGARPPRRSAAEAPRMSAAEGGSAQAPCTLHRENSRPNHRAAVASPNTRLVVVSLPGHTSPGLEASRSPVSGQASWSYAGSDTPDSTLYAL